MESGLRTVGFPLLRQHRCAAVAHGNGIVVAHIAPWRFDVSSFVCSSLDASSAVIRVTSENFALLKQESTL